MKSVLQNFKFLFSVSKKSNVKKNSTVNQSSKHKVEIRFFFQNQSGFEDARLDYETFLEIRNTPFFCFWLICVFCKSNACFFVEKMPNQICKGFWNVQKLSINRNFLGEKLISQKMSKTNKIGRWFVIQELLKLVTVFCQTVFCYALVLESRWLIEKKNFLFEIRGDTTKKKINH